MSGHEAGLSATRRRIDAICDTFEAAWRAGQKPRIEAHLDSIDLEARPALLRELLLVEWELLEERGLTVDQEACLQRFPEYEPGLGDWLRQRNPTPSAPQKVAHYKIVRLLGAGGMGEVFLAEDDRLGRQVALKLLPAAWAEDRKRRQRFAIEARAAAAVNHPNVCIIYEVGETEDGRPYLTMEFLDGSTVSQRMRQRPFTVSEVVEVAIQVADALEAAAARGVVHRDLKPANMIISSRGLVKVLDFGLAKLISDHGQSSAATTHQQTQSGQILGTPHYMSPEQATGQEVDSRSDLFSLGIILYELLTSRLPFAGGNFGETIQRIINAQPDAIARFNYGVPQELERVVRKLLEKEPARRYLTPSDLLVDLRNFRRDLEVARWSTSPAGDAATISRGSPERAQPVSSLEGSISVVGKVQEPLMLERVPDSEVLLNFAPVDDQPLLEGRRGWVSQLYRHLSVRMEQLSGERIKVACHSGFTGEPETDLELQRHLTNVKAMVSVVSPPFIKRAGCVQELQEFCSRAEQSGGLFVEDKPRLFKVLKTPVSPNEMPSGLTEIFSRLSGFEFFEHDPVTGRVREFDEAFGGVYKQQFHERLYDLAYELWQVLRILKQLQARVVPPLKPGQPRHVIYLASTTSDLQSERDHVRRELLERGHMILPETPLPLSASELERVVRGHLDKCSLAIHLLGVNYGITPEDSAESLPFVQVKLSADHARGRDLKRYLWMPENVPVVDSRQLQFLRQIQQDPQLHYRAEILEGDLSLLKRELVRWLEPPKAKPAALIGPAAKPASAPRKVYLICERRDEAAIEPLEDYLFSQGLDVCLPAFDGSDSDAEALHRENLLTCDAAIIFFGLAPRAWVDIKLRELLKAVGVGRTGPIYPQAVFVAPPQDHRKERFRSLQARVIRQNAAFEPDAELDAFIAALKAEHQSSGCGQGEVGSGAQSQTGESAK
jgi:serine/threonine protein kinase